MEDQDYTGFSIRIPVSLLGQIEAKKRQLRRSKNWIINEAIMRGLPEVSNIADAPDAGPSGGDPTLARTHHKTRTPGDPKPRVVEFGVDRNTTGYTLVEADDGYTLESAVSEKIAWDLPEAA